MEDNCPIHKKDLKGLEDPKRKHPIPITEGIWSNILSCAERRKLWKNYNTSVYKPIIEILPPNRDGLNYHLPCYKAFTSLPKSKEEKAHSSQPKSPEKAKTRRSSLSSIKSNKRGVFPKKCIICNKKRKKLDKKEQKLCKVMTDKAEDRWKKAINNSRNDYLIAILGQKEADYPAQEVHYHDCCKEKFIRKHAPASSKKESSSKNETAVNEVLVTSLSLIHDQVITKGIPVSLTEVYDAYSTVCEQKECAGEKLCRKTALSKIQLHFESSISIMNPLHKVGFILYGSALSPEDALRRFLYSDRSSSLSAPEALDMRKVVLKEAACIINDEINALKRNVDPLPPVLTKAHFRDGMCPNPPLTSSFNISLIATDPSNPTEKEKRVSDSFTSDMVYAVTKGCIKPAKHLQLGVGIKSITGSEKVGRILHGLGHSISTTQEKEIITEIGCETLEKGHAVPDGIHREPGLATTTDLDNYDEMVDTIFLDHEATHDVQGIVNQNRTAHTPSYEVLSEQQS